MNVLLTLTSFLIFFGFSLLPVQVHAAANTYYVTQNGNGSKNGNSLSNAWSVSQFNSLKGTRYAGDTFYFSGKFSTRINVNISGTSGNSVTLDGYKEGDCDPINSECTSAADSTSGMIFDGGEDYVTIQDFRMTRQSGTNACFTFLAPQNDHIIIQRNYVRETNGTMLYIREMAYSIIRNNKFTHFGQNGTDATQGVNFIEVEHSLISGNEIGHDENSYPSGCRSANTVEIHGSNNILWEYNDIYGAPNQAGIATKEWSNQTNHIYRFNKFRDNEQSGLNIGGGYDKLTNMYIYGNFAYNNGTGFDSYDTGQYHYYWSNLAINNKSHGFLTWYQSNRSTGVRDIYYYNNTAAYNGDSHSTPGRGGIVLGGAAGEITVKNNLLYNNRPSGLGSLYNQICEKIGSFSSEHNTLYHGSSTATWYYNGAARSLSTMKGYGLENDTRPGKVENPLFTNPKGADNINGTDDDDYTLQPGSPSIDDGADISECFYVNIGGGDSWFATNTGYDTVAVCIDDGLDPNNTDWTVNASQLSTNVNTLKRDTYGWARGAYVYRDGSGSQQAQQISQPTGLRIISN